MTTHNNNLCWHSILATTTNCWVQMCFRKIEYISWLLALAGLGGELQLSCEQRSLVLIKLIETRICFGL